MPLTNLGFQRKTYDDILTEQSQRIMLYSERITTQQTVYLSAINKPLNQ